jgi:hypothetical protein
MPICVPMHQREFLDTKRETRTDKMHLALAMMSVILMTIPESQLRFFEHVQFIAIDCNHLDK